MELPKLLRVFPEVAGQGYGELEYACEWGPFITVKHVFFANGYYSSKLASTGAGGFGHLVVAIDQIESLFAPLPLISRNKPWSIRSQRDVLEDARFPLLAKASMFSVVLPGMGEVTGIVKCYSSQGNPAHSIELTWIPNAAPKANIRHG
jgi:hypothetical protein